jgi:hypothetical protein
MFVALGTAGCGGISASHTVSPASFFLPGIMKANPPATNPPVAFPEKSVNFAFDK